MKVQLFQLEKANGENCQISYISEINSWVICSKNVSLLAKKESDLEIYKGKSRFYFAHLIGITWFKTLISRNISIEQIKLELKNKTLIGEYCGNEVHMHLLKYDEIGIRFYAIVDHDSLNSCISLNQAYEFFKKFNLTTVSMKDYGIFNKFHDLNLQLKEIFANVAQSPIEKEG